MNFNFFNKFYINILLASPFISSFLFCIIDSTPLYFWQLDYFKSNTGFMVLYCWLCCDYKKIRPLILLIFGVLIDLFNNIFFGFSSFFLLSIFLIQRKDNENLYCKKFVFTWLRFAFVFFIYNLLNFVFHDLFLDYIKFDIVEFVITILITVATFPIFFMLVNKLNDKIKLYNE